MVYSPTDDLFNTQQWEHWAMIFILVLGLVVGYGRAAAEDRRRARRRPGGPAKGSVRNRPRRGSYRRLQEASRRRPSPQPRQEIAPKLQRSSPGQSAPRRSPSSPSRTMQGARAIAAAPRRPPRPPLRGPRFPEI